MQSCLDKWTVGLPEAMYILPLFCANHSFQVDGKNLLTAEILNVVLEKNLKCY